MCDSCDRGADISIWMVIRHMLLLYQKKEFKPLLTKLRGSLQALGGYELNKDET